MGYLFQCFLICTDKKALDSWQDGTLRRRKSRFKKILLNINMITIFFGILLFVTGIQLPDIITETMESVSVMIGPTSMVVTGMLIGNMSLKREFVYKKIYLITFLYKINKKLFDK
ncbi:transporter, AEC family domain protein [Clostridium botulinum]|nr:transporter, AEC family domain protein [Clostridium botulinum]